MFDALLWIVALFAAFLIGVGLGGLFIVGWIAKNIFEYWARKAF